MIEEREDNVAPRLATHVEVFSVELPVASFEALAPLPSGQV